MENREIVFKLWDAQNERMSEPYYPFSDISVCFGDGEAEGDCVFVGGDFGAQGLTPLQYIGKDVSGDDIYEGFIVQMIWDSPTPKTMVIVWHQYSCAFIAIHARDYGKFIDGESDIYFRNTATNPIAFTPKIIGNIYTTPHLLTPNQNLNDANGSN